MTIERRAYMRTIKRSFIALTVIFLLILGGLAWVIDDVGNNTSRLDFVVSENQKRIADIQASRTSSCQQTYEGIRVVVLTFFTPPANIRTPEQNDRVTAFNDMIDGFVDGCTKQTKPGD